MQYHIILTERCNLKCKYCYEKSMQEFDNGLGEKWDYDEDTPFDSEVSIDKLKKFIKPEDRLIFYGGEPLVMVEKIKEIMDNLDCKFGIQTNGILLKRLPIEYIKRIDKMLVSIDGDSERTNFNRSKGVYEIVIKNLKELRSRGYSGEIVVRMTLLFPDLFKQVKHLISLIEEEIINSIHWQIDAGFYKFDFDKEKFSEFVKEYNKNISQLVNWWTNEIRNGKVYLIYPFLGIFNRIIGWDKETKLPCGSGYENFTVNTSGKLSSCPIMNSVKKFYCGDIEKGIEKEIHVQDDECEKCLNFKICGGRCLYWRDAKLWSPEGDKLICETIGYLINSIKEKVPEIENLLKKGIVKKEQFEYEKYFGPEIIP